MSEEKNVRGFKLLISGESGAGKTSLTKTMKDTLVISHDGKAYGYAIPHGTISSLSTTQELRDFVEAKVSAYADKFGGLPKTIVFDSISRIYDSLYDSCNKRFTGFNIYSNLDKDIKDLADYLEDILEAGINIVIISHALADSESGKTNLVGKGSFAKLGGFYSVVDEAIFIETRKNDKRTIHFRSTEFPARTLLSELPSSVPVADFDLQKHIELLIGATTAASEFEL